MKISLKTKLVMISTGTIVMTGLITAFIGTLLITQGVMNQVQDKVRNDLNTARELLNKRIENIQTEIHLSSLRTCIKDGLIEPNERTRDSLKACLEELRRVGNLEIAAIADSTGTVILRAHNPDCFGDDQGNDQIIAKVLSSRQMVAGTVIVPGDMLEQEGEMFEQRARIDFIDTPKAKKRPEAVETSGMMIKAAAPVRDDNGTLIGILYGGDLINRNYSLVDKIKNTVYQGEIYKGMDIGTTTIFQKDLRISTNVMSNEGERAIGTRVSEEVYDRVLDQGERWIGRAFVVNAWYVTAYEPLRDIYGNIIGMLYVGMLEQKFVDIKRRALFIFFGVTILGMIIVLVVSSFLADTIIKPIKHIVKMSKKISAGDFSVKVHTLSNDEIGELEKAFDAMASGLRERDRELKKQTQQQLMRSEKLAALGRMAAGIAHEVNNPLTGVLMYGNLLLKSLPAGSRDREDVEIIVKETGRCRELLKNLLNFSRESTTLKKMASINDVVEQIVSIIEKNVYFEPVVTVTLLAEDVPEIMLDANQFEQVLMNLALNAVEAMPEGGKLVFQTQFNRDEKNVIIKTADTGCGISADNLDKIFDPFFTTKEEGKGTGLGLAVSYGIVRRHGGQISVESSVGSGTTFTIKLPISSADEIQKGESR